MSVQIQEIQISKFKSVYDLRLTLENVNIITGANGCGKTNVYTALRFIKFIVNGRLSQELANFGGFQAVAWGGKQEEESTKIILSVTVADFEYSIEIGIRPQSEFSYFPLDPQIKSETLKIRGRMMVDRGKSFATLRDFEGESEKVYNLLDTVSIFSQLQDPSRFSYLLVFKELVNRWVFYHEFRSDAESPVRHPGFPTYAPCLHEDGSNLAPTLALIQSTPYWPQVEALLEQAFPDSKLRISTSNFEQIVQGVNTPIGPKSISDGTLKFLCLAGACFSYQPAPLLAFNEPEQSLNPVMIELLAEMFAHASQFSQLWITTHSKALVTAIEHRTGCRSIHLEKVGGKTRRDRGGHRSGAAYADDD